MTNALLYYLIVINIVTFLVYGIDKWKTVSQRGQSQTRMSFAERKQPRPKVKAKQGSWRISEATLLILAVIGGSIGALLGMKLGVLAIWPFGSKVKWKPSQPGCLSMFMNVLWFFVGGIWICLTHRRLVLTIVFYGLLLCITIIGIPWGKMHFRLAKLALSPFGMEVV